MWLVAGELAGQQPKAIYNCFFLQFAIEAAHQKVVAFESVVKVHPLLKHYPETLKLGC